MIYFVDEDSAAFGAWMSDLRIRGLEVTRIPNANVAFRNLCSIRPDEVDLVIIDVMLAVEDVHDARFSVERTDEYLETGLRLLEDLVDQNPKVFPTRAVLLTNTINQGTFRQARLTSTGFGVPLWEKSDIYSPMDFGDRVVERLRAIE